MSLARKIKSKKGFTLIELIFEIIVLTILIIPTTILLTQLSINVLETEINSTATDLCIDKAEELLTSFTYATIGNSAGNFAAPFQSYSYIVTTQYVDATNPDTVVVWAGPPDPEPEYKRATIRVSHAGITDVVSPVLFTKDVP